MKKLLLFILSIIIIYNSIGSFIAIKLAQRSIKKEIKARLKKSVPADEMVLIKLTANDIKNQKNGFRYYEKDKEFIYNDCMYDIVRKSFIHDTNYFYCINDKKEKELFKNLDLLVKNNFDINIPLKKHNEVISSLIIKGLIKKIDSSSFINIAKTVHFYPKEYHIVTGYYDIITPPPKQV